MKETLPLPCSHGRSPYQLVLNTRIHSVYYFFDFLHEDGSIFEEYNKQERTSTIFSTSKVSIVSRLHQSSFQSMVNPLKRAEYLTELDHIQG